MEKTVFWEKLAKLVSGNADAVEVTSLNATNEDDQNDRVRKFRDATIIFGKSQKEVQRSFDHLTSKLIEHEKN